DRTVTGVQTCALPILSGRSLHRPSAERHEHLRSRLQPRLQPVLLLQPVVRVPAAAEGKPSEGPYPRRRTDETYKFEVGSLKSARSEERRVGKECRGRR